MSIRLNVLGVIAALALPFCARAADPPRVVLADALPEGFSMGSAKDHMVLNLKKSGGGFIATSEAADAAITADASTSAGSTMLHLKSSANANLKLDLYISPDGKRFFYTSSCPLMGAISGTEMWPHPIHSFAFGNVRVVAGSEMVCR